MAKLNKKINLKNKIINQIMINGNKKTSEILLIKTAKQFQKQSKKQFQKVFQLAIVNYMPVFRLNEISNKKRKKKQRKIKLVPSFIPDKTKKTFLSVKFVIKNLKKEKGESFLNTLNKKLILFADNKKAFVNQKDEIQKKVVENKRYLENYRW